MTVGLRRLAGALAIALVCATLGGACGSSSNTPPASASASVLKPPGGLGLRAVVLPDVSTMEPSVRQQMQARFSSLKTTIENRSSMRDDLASAYGETGKLLMAATLLDAAEVCYANAQLLAPSDRRWPYYLGHLQGQGTD